MGDLREEIAGIIVGYDCEYDHPLELADRILAIPEIAEALEKAKRDDDGFATGIALSPLF